MHPGLIDFAVLVAFYDSWDTSGAIPSVRRRRFKFTITTPSTVQITEV
jgi:hypothetical protein